MSSNIINETENGLLFSCNSCQLIHLEFKNLNFNFTKKQLSSFDKYLNNLNADSFENINHHSPFKRKIVIPTSEDGFNFLLNKEELTELKSLISLPLYSLTPNKLLNNLNNIERCN